ncbi:putative porin [Cricetibacter osteomyelitidis]|uniref:Putative porin n=1 Tax=Cricetibacter osteomyelitidis TaxID=1521931 RepID=A0A4R2T0B8_9PAST|nr:porin [Cricetibacter osteomyelitidis]TCP94721.1 putative porin [Cricetibacter osteomyelitidis]
MKKTIIALAVAALATGSANAAVIYEKDGTKIDLDGRVHMEIQNIKDQRTDLRDVGSRFRVRAYQEIGAGFSAYGGVEMRFSNDNQIGGNFRTHRLYAGFINPEIGTLTFGRQLHLGDHVPKANYTYEWGGNTFFDAHKKAAHFMSAKFAGVRFAVDYYFGNAAKANNTSSGAGAAWDEGQGYGVGLFYDGKWDDFAVRFGSNYSEVTQSETGLKAKEYKLKRGGIGFDVKYNIVTLGFDWAFGKAEGNNQSKNIGFQKIFSYNTPLNKHNRFLIGLKVDVTPQNAIYGEYYFSKGKEARPSPADIKSNGWMLGVDHRFNKYVAVYLEGGTGKVKQDGIELKKNHRVLVGSRIMF